MNNRGHNYDFIYMHVMQLITIKDTLHLIELFHNRSIIIIKSINRELLTSCII